MKEIRSEIEINSSAERVWQILTDFASFPQWNPFMRRASGEVKKGAKLEVDFPEMEMQSSLVASSRPTIPQLRL